MRFISRRRSTVGVVAVVVSALVVALVGFAGPAAAVTQTFTWATPANSEYGVGLTAAQLDATSNVAGSIAYAVVTGPGSTAGQNITVGTVLPAGSYSLKATFTPTDTTNFTTKTATVSMAVNPVELRGKANDATRGYGAANPTFTLSALTGFVNGDTAAVVTGSATFATSATAGSPVGSYPITVDQGTLTAANYTFHLIPGDLEITPVGLTITASNGTQTYGDTTAPAITASYSGFVNGDTAASLTHAPTCTANVTAGSPVGSYSSSCTGATSSNYSLTYATGIVNVTPATLTVTASDASQTYGDTTAPAITPVYTGFKNLDDASSLSSTPTCVANVSATSPVGTYTSSCSGGAGANYTLHYVNGVVSVGQAVLTVTASNGSQTYGDTTAPAISPSYSGFVNGQSASILSSPATCSANVTATSGVGSYASTCSGAAAPNYSVHYVTGIVTVNPATLTVTASAGTQTYGDIVPASITPSYGGFRNGDTAAALSQPAVCTSGVTPLTNAGTYANTSSCSGAQAANYTFSYVNGTVTVIKAMLTAKADDAARPYGAANPPFALSGFSGFLNGDSAATSVTGSAALSTPATASSAPGAYPINAALGTLASANYTFVLSPGTLTIGKIIEPVTIVGRAVNKLSVLFYGTLTAPDGSTVVLRNVNCQRLSDGTAITKTLPFGTYPLDGSSCTFIPIIAPTYDTGAVTGSFTAAAEGITTVSLPDGQLGAPYKANTTLAATGLGTKVWSVVGGSLPPGMTLSTSGLLAGTTNTAGVFPFTVQVKIGAFTQTWVYAISVPPLAVTSTTLPNGQIGVSYRTTLTSNVAKTPAHWSLIGGALPGGVTMTSAGVISGKPTTPGTYSFTVRVTDSSVPAHAATQALSITVLPMLITTSSLKSGKTKTFYSVTLTATGGTTPRTWTVTSGALPPGLKLSAAGTISGTPTTAGSYSFTVRATDAVGNTATASLSITIS